jgi:ABC-type polysaccharide/polyol phosphate transport system ATPase subunit
VTAVLVLETVTKRFPAQRLGTRGIKTLALHPRAWLRRPETSCVTAVDAVSLEVRAGEIVGLIGANGAGKSTLLELAAQILEPSSGRVTVHGRCSTQLGLGIGFASELSGRRNAILNGVLLGLRRAEVERALGDIVRFAGLEHVIDQPLRTYSSGLQMRLGFAVAIHARPQLLLVDEVLAVGDLEFQTECLERIRALRAGGTAILVASHSLELIESLCDRALLLERGRVSACGAPADVVTRYEARKLAESGERGAASAAAAAAAHAARRAARAARVAVERGSREGTC